MVGKLYWKLSMNIKVKLLLLKIVIYVREWKYWFVKSVAEKENQKVGDRDIGSSSTL